MYHIISCGELGNLQDNYLLKSSEKGKIVSDSTICTGCRVCELVCSLFHEGVVKPEIARIQVITNDWQGWQSEVYPCNQCDDAECLAACPTDAIVVDDSTGAKVVDETKCSGCQLCVEACPYTPPRIRYDTKKNVCVKCDLCGGTPQCVIFCQEGVLSLDRV